MFQADKQRTRDVNTTNTVPCQLAALTCFVGLACLLRDFDPSTAQERKRDEPEHAAPRSRPEPHSSGFQHPPESEEQNINVEWRDLSGKTPIMRAAQVSDLRTVQRLLGLGANVNAKDMKGSTALHHAAGQGDGEIIEVLIRAGANIEEKNIHGHTSLLSAARRGNAWAGSYQVWFQCRCPKSNWSHQFEIRCRVWLRRSREIATAGWCYRRQKVQFGNHTTNGSGS